MNEIPTAISPMLSVRRGKAAVEFYKTAFHATEVFRLDAPDGSVLSRLRIETAEFWVSDESPDHANFSPETVGGGTVRMILTVPSPDAVFDRAIEAGAKVVYPVSEAHGWRLGRLEDPYGHHWEIGRELSTGIQDGIG